MERHWVSGADGKLEGSTLKQGRNVDRRSSRMGTIKRAFAGTLVAVALVGGSLAGTAAKAGSPPAADSAGTGYTETTGTTTDDGTIIFVCTYDDVTGELLFCDVYFYPRNSAKAGKAGKQKNASFAPPASSQEKKAGKHKNKKR